MQELRGALLSALTPHLMGKLVNYEQLRSALLSQRYTFQFLIAAHSEEEFSYQDAALRRIVEDTRGECLDLRALPALKRSMLWGFLRSSLPPLIFRRRGSFNTSFGAL